MTRELKYVQGELTEKETIFQRVEQELRNKLVSLEEVTAEKSDLRRRIDDLQSELRHLQTSKLEKEEKLKMQIRKNEELLDQLERMNEAMATMKDEKETTLLLKAEKEREAEFNQRIVAKVGKIADRIAKLLAAIKKQAEVAAAELKAQVSFPQMKQEGDTDGLLMEIET